MISAVGVVRSNKCAANTKMIKMMIRSSADTMPCKLGIKCNSGLENHRFKISSDKNSQRKRRNKGKISRKVQ